MALPTMVTAKSGKQYSSDSPQGQVIIQARERAAASVAASQPFSSDSSALDSISPVINDIATDIGTINENVNSLVMIAQADARGDILGAADVVPEGGTGTDANGVPIGGLGGGADDPEGNLAGLGVCVCARVRICNLAGNNMEAPPPFLYRQYMGVHLLEIQSP